MSFLDNNANSTSSINSESVLLTSKNTTNSNGQPSFNMAKQTKKLKATTLLSVDASNDKNNNSNVTSFSTDPLLTSLSLNTPLLIKSHSEKNDQNLNFNCDKMKNTTNFIDLNDLNKISSITISPADHHQLGPNISCDDSLHKENYIPSIKKNFSLTSSTSSTQSVTSQTKLTVLTHIKTSTNNPKSREDAILRDGDDDCDSSSFKSQNSLKFNKDSSLLDPSDIAVNGSANSALENLSLSIGKRLAMIQPEIILANTSSNISNINSNSGINRRSNSLNSISMLSVNNLSVNGTENNGSLTIANTTNNNSYLNGVIVKDPVLIRGAGNITIFGVSNRFSEQFPTQLNAKLAPEEFKDTIKQINNILNKELANSLKWLVFGSIFCCCTLGCSLLPVIFMNKKARLSINKLLEMENQRLYLKLGLKWRLAKVKCNSNTLLEYVLLIEFLPTILLYQPD